MAPQQADDQADGQDQHRPGGVSRRKLLGAGAAGAGALWIAPSILALDTPAAAASICPAEVLTARTTGYGGVSSSARSVTLNPTGLQPGDVWVMVAAYSADTGATISTSGLSGMASTSGSATGGSSPLGPNEWYSVQAILYTKTLTAGDLTGGAMSVTVTTSANNITYGGLRVAGTAFRAGSTLSAVGTTVNAGDGTPATFPAPSALPGGNYALIRVGALRGYGGCTGSPIGSDLGWIVPPASSLFTFESSNNGDRSLSFSRACNGTGTATGTWFTRNSILGNCPGDPAGFNYVTFTTAVG